MSDQAAAATVPLDRRSPSRASATEQKTKRQPPYHVILWNDDDHSYEYVIADADGAVRLPTREGVSVWPRRWTRRAG